MRRGYAIGNPMIESVEARSHSKHTREEEHRVLADEARRETVAKALSQVIFFKDFVKFH